MGRKQKKKVVITLFVVLSLFLVLRIAYPAILIFGTDRVIWFPSDTQTAGCNAPGPGFYYCDNAKNTTLDNTTLGQSMTIDTCTNGDNVPEGNTFYEYLKDVRFNDENGTNITNPYPEGGDDPYIRGGDNIKVTLDMDCYKDYFDPDVYYVLYKNNTNSTTPWRLVANSQCYPPGIANYSVGPIIVDVTVTLDNIVGNHTIRSFVAWDEGNVDFPSFFDCGYDIHNQYSDTDDIILEVEQSKDFHPPIISNINIDPVVGGTDDVQLVENLTINVNFTVTDQTGIGVVNVSLVHNNVTTPMNYTNISGVYYFNISNVTELGFYEFVFWANDTIEENITLKTKNHVNNYTTAFFYLKNDIFITIFNPSFNTIFSTTNIDLDFRINDLFSPFREVYYELNTNKTTINNSKYTQTTKGNNNTYLNNSQNNISQSFTLLNDTVIRDIRLFVKRIGNPNTNTTVLLINDSSGSPNGIILASNNTVTSIDNNSFGWVNIRLNQSVNITASTKYWVSLLSANQTDYIHWSYNDTNPYAGGEAYSNNSLDLSLRIFDVFNYNYTINDSVEGLNTLYVCENNSFGDVGCGFSQYYVDLSSPYFQNLNYASEVERGNLQMITIEVKDDIGGVDKVLLSFNNTNFTMTKIWILPKGGRYRYSLNITTPGTNYNFTVFANDSLGWYDITPTYFFNVTDTLEPALTNIAYTPFSQDARDPNVTLFFNYTLFDHSLVNQTIFQIRPNTTGVWTNRTSLNLGGDKYSANYTPSLETKYYFRVYTKDNYGNDGYTTQQEIDVLYERYWNYSPVVYSDVLVQGNTNYELYNVTITNYGDVSIPFNVSDAPSVQDAVMNYNNASFNISNNSSFLLRINVTSPGWDDTFPAQAIITCLANCARKTATIGESIIVGGAGPYLDLKIYKVINEDELSISNLYRLKYNHRTYTTPSRLLARVTNIAAYDADNITFWWSFPNSSVGWVVNYTNPQNLTANFSLERKNFDDTQELPINFTISTQTNGSRLYDIIIFANLTFNGSPRVFNKTVQINVSYEEEDNSTIIIINTGGGDTGGGTTPPPTITKTGGGGGAVGFGGGTTIKYNLSVEFLRNIDLLRGTNKTISLNISNIFKNRYFSGINISTLGYYQNQIRINTLVIDELLFNETKQVNITLSAPTYLGYSTYDVRVIFDYLSTPTGFNLSLGEKQSTEVSFNLIIGEVNRSESQACLENSNLIIQDAKNLGVNTRVLEETFLEQTTAFSRMDFTLASNLCDKISADFENILLYKNRLEQLKSNIDQSIRDGYDLEDVNRLYEINLGYFEDGDYYLLEDTIRDLESAYALQISTEDANLLKRFTKFFKNNLKEIFIFLAVFAVIANFATKKAYSVFVKKKIVVLETQVKNYNHKIRDLQNKYFLQKIIGPDYFNLHVEKEKDHMAKLNEELLKYNSLSLKYDKKSSNVEVLIDQELAVKYTMSRLQKQYYLEKNIDKKSFDKLMMNQRKLLSRIKKELLIAKNKQKNMESKPYYKYIEYFKKRYDKIREKIVKKKKFFSKRKKKKKEVSSFQKFSHADQKL
ncbi:hypothetical protein GOV05_01555 [Candidatus Woesearchaeota archaeon]|nr:hypothetical protein [Candidatus Woesearchaeota archaeon]